MCKCCEEIKFIEEELKTNIRYKLQAQIVRKSYRKSERKPSGIIHFSSYNLNYCPLCGRKINKE